MGITRPPPRHRLASCRYSAPWRRYGEYLARALQAAGETPRRRLAPGEGAARALALDELTGAEVPVRGGGVARPLRRPCACAFGLAAQRQPQQRGSRGLSGGDAVGTAQLPAELATGAVSAATLAALDGGSCAAPAGPSVGPSAQRPRGAEVLGPRRPGRRSPGPSLAQAPKTRGLFGPGAEVLGPCWPERRRPGPSLTRGPKT